MEDSMTKQQAFEYGRRAYHNDIGVPLGDKEFLADVEAGRGGMGYREYWDYHRDMEVAWADGWMAENDLHRSPVTIIIDGETFDGLDNPANSCITIHVDGERHLLMPNYAKVEYNTFRPVRGYRTFIRDESGIRAVA
jgi:hypothetical protein